MGVTYEEDNLRKFLAWLIFAAILPLGFVWATWEVVQFFPGINLSREEIFGTGDLLAIAAVLLLNTNADLRCEKDKLGVVLTGAEAIFSIAGFAAIFVYAAFKISALQILKKTPIDADTLLTYEKFSWVYVVAAVVFTATTKFKLLKVIHRK